MPTSCVITDCRQVFARLKNKTDSAELQRQQDELNTRLFAQHQKSQERLAELVRAPLAAQSR